MSSLWAPVLDAHPWSSSATTVEQGVSMLPWRRLLAQEERLGYFQ